MKTSSFVTRCRTLGAAAVLAVVLVLPSSAAACGGGLYGWVYRDYNGSGYMDAANEPINGATVCLYRGSTEVACTKTAANPSPNGSAHDQGEFVFSAPGAGTYTMRVVAGLPSGWTTINASENDGKAWISGGEGTMTVQINDCDTWTFAGKFASKKATTPPVCTPNPDACATDPAGSAVCTGTTFTTSDGCATVTCQGRKSCTCTPNPDACAADSAGNNVCEGSTFTTSDGCATVTCQGRKNCTTDTPTCKPKPNACNSDPLGDKTCTGSTFVTDTGCGKIACPGRKVCGSDYYKEIQP